MKKISLVALVATCVLNITSPSFSMVSSHSDEIEKIQRARNQSQLQAHINDLNIMIRRGVSETVHILKNADSKTVDDLTSTDRETGRLVKDFTEYVGFLNTATETHAQAKRRFEDTGMMDAQHIRQSRQTELENCTGHLERMRSRVNSLETDIRSAIDQGRLPATIALRTIHQVIRGKSDVSVEENLAYELGERIGIERCNYRPTIQGYRVEEVDASIRVSLNEVKALLAEKEAALRELSAQ